MSLNGMLLIQQSVNTKLKPLDLHIKFYFAFHFIDPGKFALKAF